MGIATGGFDFVFPSCTDGDSGDNNQYEIRYMRNFEVLDRVLLSADVVTPRVESNFNTLGLEHLLIFLSVIGIVVFVVAFVIFRKRAEEMSGYSPACLSGSSHDDDVLLERGGGSHKL